MKTLIEQMNGKEPLQFWGDMGLLSGLQEPFRTKAANAFTRLTDFILHDEDYLNENEKYFETVAFPMTRRILCVDKHVEDINPKELWLCYKKFYDVVTTITEIFIQKSEKEVTDIEAENVAVFCAIYNLLLQKL